MSGVHDHVVATAKPKEVAPFLKSLRQILDSENTAIIRWTPDGKAFEIHDMNTMMHLVLPRYFKHSKYTSFQRQLNYFNFRKWTKSKAVVCTFSNPFFQRDQPALAWRITRKKSLHSDDKGPRSGSVKSLKAKKLSRSPKAIVIKLLRSESGNQTSLPSPTDANTLEMCNVFGTVSDITFHDSLGSSLDANYSLDWVDTLYSSLEPQVNNAAHPSFLDHAFDYTEL
ncbi:HSF-type DNA-binding [Phytophthora infestans]|uniref:HSF-type DNA-binding n=1 Tax=Phytophthora infestans TaxID=4787 RepID=A0A8S9U1C0_PHYIN|nr:HSF-type DNA-binding [Phytophthora infestans]